MKIILAIDDSQYSKQVVDCILKRRWPDGVNFKILTVLEPICFSMDDCDQDQLAGALLEIDKRRKHAAERLCRRVCDKIEAAIPSAKAHFEIREGSARSEIVNAAVDWMADRIMIGAHGKHVCPHNLPGSVSRSVVMQAPCSVEVVRAQSLAKKNGKKVKTAKSFVTIGKK